MTKLLAFSVKDTPRVLQILGRVINNISDPLFRPGGGGGGLLRPSPTLQLNNFKTIKTMTTKFSDFS